MSETIDSRSWRQRVAVSALRLCVGAVFAFSGFVKAVDPYGSYYKITEYLHALGWESLLGLALFGAVMLAAVEFALGVMTITGTHRRVTPLLMLLLLLVMTPLTLWLAVTDMVKDCGCFGDAWHMSNTATFVKNVVLLVGVVLLLKYNKRVVGVYSPVVHWFVTMLALSLPLAVSYVGYFIQPGIDFRPYPVGTHLVPTGTEPDDSDYLFTYERDGVRQDFSIDSLPDDEDGWIYVERRVAGPAIKADSDAESFTLRDVKTVADVSADVLTDTADVILLLFPNLTTVSAAHTYSLNRLTDIAHADSVAVAGVTGAGEHEIEMWGDISMADYTMYRADDSDVKMLARGNPAVVFVHRGRIVWKSTLSWLESIDAFDGSVPLVRLGDKINVDDMVGWLFFTWLTLMTVLAILNRVPVFLMRCLARGREQQGETVA